MPLSDTAKVGAGVAGAALAATIAVFGVTHTRPAPSPAGGWDAGPPVCACSSGTGCSVPGLPFNPATFRPQAAALVEAPRGITLAPGWQGGGCVAKACTQLAGQDSWPASCPLE